MISNFGDLFGDIGVLIKIQTDQKVPFPPYLLSAPTPVTPVATILDGYETGNSWYRAPGFFWTRPPPLETPKVPWKYDNHMM